LAGSLEGKKTAILEEARAMLVGSGEEGASRRTPFLSARPGGP
jgi:hypothetical protein